jgi:hypothetical protein
VDSYEYIDAVSSNDVCRARFACRDMCMSSCNGDVLVDGSERGDEMGEEKLDNDGEREGNSEGGGHVSNFLYWGRYCGHDMTLCNMLSQHKHLQFCCVHVRAMCPCCPHAEQIIIDICCNIHFDLVCCLL